MAIIGTLPSRFSEKNQQLTLQRVRVTSKRIHIIYISVQGKSIGNIQNYGAKRGVLDYIKII